MFFKRKQQPYKITVISNGSKTYECQTEKEKQQWLYDYLTNNERLWAWAQWQQSTYKTFDQWFKAFIKPTWKESTLQTFRINKTLILVKKIENN